jgi:hypothetical protein
MKSHNDGLKIAETIIIYSNFFIISIVGRVHNTKLKNFFLVNVYVKEGLRNYKL